MESDDSKDDITRSVQILAPDTMVAHYRIIEHIKSGGMGEVYLAEDCTLRRRVALKMLSQPLSSDPAFRQRFAKEAQALAALNHPHIVTIYEIG